MSIWKQLFPLQKISVPVCFAILPLTASAGDPHFMPAGAGQAGMAYVCVMKNDFWSAFHNQAALSANNKILFGASYENRFGIPELGTCTSAITIPAGKAALGAIYSHFGYSDFRRQMAGVACGMPLSENVSAGIQIDYFSEKTYGEYTATRAVTFEAGLQASVNENVRIGIHLFNPVPGSMRKKEMVSGLNAGAGVDLGKGLFAGMETELTTAGYVDIRTGFEYELSRDLWLRAGFRTQHSSFSFGVGYRIKPAVIDISFATHDKLGITSSVSLTFNIK
jgi:hypothetical protein